MIPTTAATLAVLAAAATAQQSPFPEGKDRIELPMRLLENDAHLEAAAVVEATIGAARLTLLLDSGASFHVLHKATVERLELELGNKMFLIGMSDTQEVRRVKIPKLVLGELTFERVFAATVDTGQLFDGYRRAHGVEIDGILGTPFFAAGAVTFDFANEKLLIARPGTWEPPAGACVIPLESTLGIPVIKAQVKGRRPARFLVDTGHAHTLILHGDYAQRRGLLAREAELLQFGIGGMFAHADGRLGILAELRIGDLVAREVPTILVLPGKGIGVVRDRARAGNIGLGLWSRFELTLDYENARLALRPRGGVAGGGEIRFEPDFGMRLRVRHRKIAVHSVMQGSPAAAAGLRRFDALVEIDGDAPPLDTSTVVRALRQKDKVRLRVERLRTEPFEVELERRAYLSPVEDAPK